MKRAIPVKLAEVQTLLIDFFDDSNLVLKHTTEYCGNLTQSSYLAEQTPEIRKLVEELTERIKEQCVTK